MIACKHKGIKADKVFGNIVIFLKAGGPDILSNREWKNDLHS